MNKIVQATISVALRDYAAFEDICEESGIKVLDVSLTDAESKPKKSGKHRRHHPLKKEDVTAILDYMANNQHATNRDVVKALGLPYSVSTVSRIRNNQITPEKFQ